MNTMRILYEQYKNNPATGYTSPLRVTWDAITSNSIVLISASEYDSDHPHPEDPRWIRNGLVTVRSIAPADGYVDFWIDTSYNGYISLAVDIVVLDQPPVGIFVSADMQYQDVVPFVAPHSTSTKQETVTGFLKKRLSARQMKEYEQLLIKELGYRGRLKATGRRRNNRG
jgi:hypothetical protein